MTTPKTARLKARAAYDKTQTAYDKTQTARLKARAAYDKTQTAYDGAEGAIAKSVKMGPWSLVIPERKSEEEIR